jgi:hypothetical protein
MATVEEMLEGSFGKQSFVLDPGLTQFYLLKYSIENNVLLHSVLRRQLEIIELIKTGDFDKEKITEILTDKLNSIFDISEKEIHETLAHIASAAGKK